MISLNFTRKTLQIYIIFSEFNSDTEKCLPDGFQESFQMSRSRKCERNIMDWLNGLVANVYVEGMIKLMQHLDKCLNLNGDYIEKLTCCI
jgi:hypothetical protein